MSALPKYFMWFALASLFLLLIFSAILTIYASQVGAPIFLSNKKIIERAFEYLKINSSSQVCDLGAGTGRVMILAKHRFGARISGFELSPIFFVLAKLNLFLRGMRKNDLRLADFYKNDLSENDVIFCFLSIRAMKRLKSKFEKELKSGTKIVSYAFKIPGWETMKIFEDKDSPGKVYVYEIK